MNNKLEIVRPDGERIGLPAEGDVRTRTDRLGVGEAEPIRAVYIAGISVSRVDGFLQVRTRQGGGLWPSRRYHSTPRS